MRPRTLSSCPSRCGAGLCAGRSDHSTSLFLPKTDRRESKYFGGARQADEAHTPVVILGASGGLSSPAGPVREAAPVQGPTSCCPGPEGPLMGLPCWRCPYQPHESAFQEIRFSCKKGARTGDCLWGQEDWPWGPGGGVWWRSWLGPVKPAASRGWVCFSSSGRGRRCPLSGLPSPLDSGSHLWGQALGALLPPWQELRSPGSSDVPGSRLSWA